MGRNTELVTLVSGQSWLGAQTSARGAAVPARTNGPNGPLCGFESAKVGNRLSAGPGAGAGGAAL
eukprot:5184848-Alexandrium_andersonii.AAC.1